MRALARPALGLLLVLGLACRPPHNPLAEWDPSPNFNPRRPQMVVLHHTAEPSFDSALRCLKTENSGGPVSAHFLIGKDGRVLQLVSEDDRAWHAGGGSWGPYRDLNSMSIGIELDNDGAEPFPEAQLRVLIPLLKDLVARYRIAPHLVLGHADVDPIRKVDPNPQFPWQRLAQEGLGLWPDPVLADPPPGFDPWRAFTRIGYGLKDRKATVRAFRIHYRGTAEGDLDDQDLRILSNLARKAEAAIPGA